MAEPCNVETVVVPAAERRQKSLETQKYSIAAGWFRYYLGVETERLISKATRQGEMSVKITPADIKKAMNWHPEPIPEEAQIIAFMSLSKIYHDAGFDVRGSVFWADYVNGFTISWEKEPEEECNDER